MPLKYEHLGIFCNLYGIMGHIDEFCEKLLSIAKDDGTRQWSSNIRAEVQNVTRIGWGR